MTDLTQLSDAQLQALYAQGGQGVGPAQTPTQPPSVNPAAYAETPLSADEAHGLMAQSGGPQPYAQTADQAQAWETDPTAKFPAPKSYLRQDPQTGVYYLRAPAPPTAQAPAANAASPPAEAPTPVGQQQAPQPAAPDSSDLSRMSDADLLAAYQAQSGASPSLPPPNTSGGGDPGAPASGFPTLARSADATVRALSNAATFGLANRAQAAMDAFPALVHGGLDAFGPQFTSNMNAQQQRDAADAREVPFATWPSRIAGTVASAAALPEVPAASLIGRAAVGAGQGALLTGLDAIGNARGDLGQMSASAAVPMATGAALGGAFGGVLGAKPPVASQFPGLASPADYAASGIDPVPAIVGGKGVQQIGQMLAGNPIMGGPLRRAAASSLSQGQAGAERVAGAYGSATTPFEAGGALQRGATDGVQAMRQVASKLYAPINTLDRGAAPVPVASTQTALQDVFGRYTSPGMQTWFRQNAPKLAQLHDTLNGQGASPSITFPELRSLRSDLGSMLQDHTINTVDQAQLKRVYGAMTDDYYNAAQQLGGSKARTAAVRADAYYAAMRQRVSDVLDSVIKTNSPEQAFDRVKAMAGSTARADQRQLETLKRSVPPEAWNQVSAGVIRSMGKGADGSFSMSTLATNWGKLSPAGRTALFGGNRSIANEKALSSLMRVAADTKAASKFYNSSQSGNHLVTALMLEEPVRNALEGHVEIHSTAAMAALAGLGFGASRLLASPGFARLALMAARSDTKAAVADASSRLSSYAGQNPDLAAHIEAFRNDFLSRVRTNAPVTSPARLAASSGSRR